MARQTSLYIKEVLMIMRCCNGILPIYPRSNCCQNTTPIFGFSSCCSANTNSSIDVTSVYVGIPGPQGPQGPRGLTGPIGPTGATGPAGADGVDGVSAGFGTPTATATTLPEGSDATVTVTASGEDTAKVFNFSFGNCSLCCYGCDNLHKQLQRFP